MFVNKDENDRKILPLGPLRGFSGFFEAEFAALLHARVAFQETKGF